ncbi:acetylcholine receptor subunit alpha-like 2-like isoform X1 [Aplysia californica]|uniref:Acetylcholine receptor subunit alpha-like 2-like isoform X1 n=1 Tax=Aplysia californica TaxID=6500 RepID=M4VN04_APLCA|nr:acetylcholine receptor subunit alpha-like 2-like precursor [Aplysia californica]XP_012936402.1 acetylcholine receptor subunit alpha-like 2-like isoform X1 [Aplysia californica]AGI03859.1 nicotinic acetylcholine receptor subunit type C [Aplysia californica]
MDILSMLWALLVALVMIPVGEMNRVMPDPAAKRLFYDLMQVGGYNALIRPSAGPLRKLTVKLGLRLSQVLTVDERNQILTISVWLRQEWYDLRLKWDPSDYGGVKVLNIPSEELWKPDLVLYNNADGDFQITLKTKAIVYNTGKIVWEPPAIYKSYCPIDVEYFPFDIQECFLKISSWTYHGDELDLQHLCNGSIISRHDDPAKEEIIIPRGIDLTDYYYNVEWDVLNVTAMKRVKFYPCCPEPYPDITFNITLRRRTLFYTLNLIMPCVSISCLTVLVFYLPSDSGEKITLSISILLALTVFFLLLSDMNPPTSLTIPLIGKYLLFIMIVVTMSITLTVYTLHINFKSPTTHKMSPWVKRIFTEILPRVLFMKRPELQDKNKVSVRTVNGIEQRESPSPAHEPLHTYENVRTRNESAESEFSSPYYPPEVMEAIQGVTFIANHLRKGDEDIAEERDWKYIAMVMDRFFLYIFTTACFCGTLSIFLYAPSLYDAREHMEPTDPNNTCIY